MIRIIKYQLYLLQLENYEVPRYLRLIFKKGILPTKELRSGIVWTGKAKLILMLSVILHFLIAIILSLVVWNVSHNIWLSLASFLLILFVLLFIYFIFNSLSVLIIVPVNLYLKRKIIVRAKAKLSGLSGLKVIGIAGSYGKTSMKEALRVTLSESFKVAATPDSVNTPLGIAKFIETDINQQTQILIVEIGEHYRGDVAEICDLVRPDIGLITGINESHLERLDSLQSTVETIFELSSGLKPQGTLLLNADDQNILDHYHNFIGDRKPLFYSSYNNQLGSYLTPNYRISTDDLRSYFDLMEQNNALGSVKSRILGEYVRGMAVAAVIVSTELGQSVAKAINGFEKLSPISHRLEPIVNPNGLLVIDDSYNGNPDGVKEAIKLLSRFTNHRRVYLTPGLVETGHKTQEIHEQIGRDLAGKVDLVLLIKNSVTPFIEAGLIQSGFANNRIIWYSTAQEAHKALAGILQKNDVILFQNDWGDQYL